MFLAWPLGALFIAFQLGLLEFGFFLLVLYFSSQSQLLAPLDILYRLLLSWIAYVNTNHEILGLLMRQRRDEYKIHLEDSSVL